jgi:hypothetical protein
VVRMVLLENINCVDKEAVLRSYDCKGSSFDRLVRKTGFVKEYEKVSEVMKDCDFHRIEKGIMLSD